MKVKIPAWAAGLSYRDRRGSSKKRAEDDGFNFLFVESRKKRELKMENSKLVCRAKKPSIMRIPCADNSIEFDRIEDRESDKTATRQLMFSFGGFEW